MKKIIVEKERFETAVRHLLKSPPLPIEKIRTSKQNKKQGGL